MKIRLSGAKNCRDFSEYGHGGFIRSAHLHGLTAGDKALLTERYRLRTVIDLRTSQEVREQPDAELPGVTRLHIPLFDGPVPGISHEKETDEILGRLPDMALLYRLLVTEEPYVGQIRKVMEVLNDPEREGAVLWHCTEGKDRCGLISALFLLSRGVDCRTVMEDYLRTNRVNLPKAWKYYLLVLLARRDPAAAAGLRDAFLARREYLGPVMGRLTALAKTFSV